MTEWAARSPWSRVALVMSVALVAVSLLVSLARLVGFEMRPLAAVMALMPWFALAASLALILAVVARAWIPAAVAALTVALNGWWLAPLYGEAMPGDPEFTVVTLNASYGDADAREIVRLVTDSDVDVLTVQELTPDLVERLGEAGLGELLPHALTQPQTNHAGIGLWSRTEIKDGEPLDELSSWALRGQIDTAHGEHTVFAVHPLPPLPRGHARWAEDMEALIALVGEAEGPVMVAGDFNTTRDHASFRRLQSLGFVDESDEAGSGLQFTFPEGGILPPMVAIDHILTRASPWAAVEVRTVTVTGSDHRALVVHYAAR